MSFHRAALLAFVAVCMVSPIEAAPPPHFLQDVLQTLRARKMLLDDEVLGPLNLGVHVQGRIAVLWGPVPSAGLGLRAEARLRGMIELIDVRNELTVLVDDPADEPIRSSPPRLLVPEKSLPPLPAPPRPFLRNNPSSPIAVARR